MTTNSDENATAVEIRGMSEPMWRRWILVILFGFAQLSLAQPPVPNLQAIFPAGSTQGATTEVIATGNHLQTAFSVWVNGKGVTGEILKVENNNQVRLKLTVAPDAELGERDVRIVTKGGVSNRVRFIVSPLAEIKEKEPNSTTDQAQVIASFPIVINGTLNPGDDVDCFRISLKAGEMLTAELYGQRLFPYLPSAGGQPGFLDGVLRVRDSNGRELIFVDDLYNRPDPALAFIAPSDGEYVLELHDISYRGSVQFVYRLFIGKTPVVMRALPLGWQAGMPVRLQLFRFLLNEPSFADVIVPPSPTQLVKVWFSLDGQPVFSPVPLLSVPFQTLWEVEPNNTKEQANPLTIPVGVNGTIYCPGDVDCFAFTAKAKQRFVMEVWAWRLFSPLDSVLEVLNEQGQVIAANDDHPDFLKRPDSYLEWTAPSDGNFFVKVSNRLTEGGIAFAYFLLLRPFQPDFEVRITEDNPRVPQGGTVAIPVSIVRREGFNGEVTVTVTDLPSGWKVRPLILPSGQNEGRLTLTTPDDAPLGAMPLGFIGSASIDNQPVTREGIGLETVQYVDQQRQDTVKVVVLGVIEPLAFRLSTPEVVEGIVGETLKIPVKVERRDDFKGSVQIQVVQGLPPKAKTDAITIGEGQSEGVIEVQLASVTPQGIFTLLLEGQGKVGDQNITAVAPSVRLIVKGK